MGLNNVLKARVAGVIPMAGAAALMAVGGLLGAAPVAAAAAPALAGETLTATVAHDAFSASCWTSGSYSVDFSLHGTAAGPYPGRFTESGTIRYALHRYLYGSDGAVAWAQITGFSATFAITSAAGIVAGATRLDARVPGEQEANCGGGHGGQALGAVVGTRYAATITTPRGRYTRHGTSTATLSGVNSGNTQFATSLAESFGAPAAAPVSTAPPTIAGVAAPAVSASAGGELTAFQPGWDNAPVAFAYQWLRCDTAGGDCSLIRGATDRSYTPETADVGSTMRVQQWASNTAGTGGPATSDPTGVISPPAPSALPQQSDRRPHASGSPLAAMQIRAELRRRLRPAGRAVTIPAVLRAGGSAVSFTARSAGRVAIVWYHARRGAHLRRAHALVIASGAARFAHAGRVTLSVSLTAAGRRFLTAARRLRLTAKVTYVPRGRPAVTVGRRFTLRR